MKIIDSRSGAVMTPGKIVVYGGGEKIRVVDVDEGLFSARALIATTRRDPLVTSHQWVRLDVRFMHPSYLFERVAFIPS